MSFNNPIPDMIPALMANLTNATGPSPSSIPIDGGDWSATVLLVIKASIMILIMAAAVFGNLLVIVSVMRHRKLR